MPIKVKAHSTELNVGQARLTGTVFRIIQFPDAAWVEIVVDGAPDLFREVRVPYPIHNDDGTISPVKVGDRVNIMVSPAS